MKVLELLHLLLKFYGLKSIAKNKKKNKKIFLSLARVVMTEPELNLKIELKSREMYIRNVEDDEHE